MHNIYSVGQLDYFCSTLMAVHGLVDKHTSSDAVNSKCVCGTTSPCDHHYSMGWGGYQLTNRCSLDIWTYATKGILLLDREGLTAYGGQVNSPQPLLCCQKW